MYDRFFVLRNRVAFYREGVCYSRTQKGDETFHIYRGGLTLLKVCRHYSVFAGDIDKFALVGVKNVFTAKYNASVKGGYFAGIGGVRNVTSHGVSVNREAFKFRFAVRVLKVQTVALSVGVKGGRKAPVRLLLGVKRILHGENTRNDVVCFRRLFRRYFSGGCGMVGIFRSLLLAFQSRRQGV